MRLPSSPIARSRRNAFAAPTRLDLGELDGQTGLQATRVVVVGLADPAGAARADGEHGQVHANRKRRAASVAWRAALRARSCLAGGLALAPARGLSP